MLTPKYLGRIAWILAALALLAWIVMSVTVGDVETVGAAGPEGTVFVGGPDGGVFVGIRPAGPPGRYRGEIYYPSGERWYSGELVLEPAGAAPDLARPGVFSGWDGERLHLSDGRALRAIGSAERP